MEKLYKAINANTDITDQALRVACNEIANTYSDIVDVNAKSKTVLRLGENTDVDTAWETVWQLGGDETYLTANNIYSISSSDDGDNQDIYIEGHTVSGTGADAKFSYITQTVTMDGQTQTALTAPLARVSYAANRTGTALAGDVYLYEITTITSGVPDDLTKAHMKISGSDGHNQSLKAAATLSNRDYFIMTGFDASVSSSAAAAVEFELQVREVGQQFLPKARFTANTAASSAVSHKFNPYVIIPKNADVRVRAKSSSANATVTASFAGYVAAVV